MRKSQIHTAIGERMEQVAKSLGLSAKRIADRMNVSETSIYRYWSGERRQTDEVLEAYAAIVGCSADYLRWGNEKPMGPSGPWLEWALRLADLVNQGMEPEEAIHKLSADRPINDTGIPNERLTLEERELLHGQGAVLREVLEVESGGEFDALEAHEKALILQLVRSFARRKADRGDEPKP